MAARNQPHSQAAIDALADEFISQHEYQITGWPGDRWIVGADGEDMTQSERDCTVERWLTTSASDTFDQQAIDSVMKAVLLKLDPNSTPSETSHQQDPE